VYAWDPSTTLLVVNAGNIMKDHEWIAARAQGRGDVSVVNSSSRYALLALQGPASQAILQTLTGVDLSAIKYYWFATGEVASIRATISRTGYTGEDGFEIFVPPASAERLWMSVLAAGRDADRPCGLGARQAAARGGHAPRGSDMDDRDERARSRARLDRRAEEIEFLGATACALQRRRASRKLVPFEMKERAMRVTAFTVADGRAVGVVTAERRRRF
jgi:aminomethyltransferase